MGRSTYPAHLTGSDCKLGMSRALPQLHLRKLEIAGLVSPALAWSVVAIWKSRTAHRTDAEYKDMWTRSVRSQENNERRLHDLHDEVTAVNARLQAVERVLEEVD